MAKKKSVKKTTQSQPKSNILWENWAKARRLMNITGTQSREAILQSFLSRDIDMNYECRWPEDLNADDCKLLYERFGVATRVVEIWPNECWILPPDVYEVEDQDEETEFEKAWKAMEKRHHVISYLKRVDILSGIGRYGVMVFGLDDLQTGEDFSQPVEGMEEILVRSTLGDSWTPLKHRLLYIKVYQESDAEIVRRDDNPSSPRYGQPVEYRIKMESPTSLTSATTIQKNVHWTRCLHIADNRLSSEIFGEPRMKPVYNDLIDLRKMKGGASEGYWRACLSGIMWGLHDKLMDPSATLTADQKESFIEELQQYYYNSLQRDIISMGLVPHDIAPKLVDPSPFVRMLIEMICIKMDVPVSIFMGREEGKLAADENRSSWLERVKGRQNNYVTPYIIRPFVERLQMYGVLPLTQEEEFMTDWPDRDSPSEKDIAETAVKTTQALAQYVSSGVNQLFGEREYLGQVFKKTTDEIDAIATEVDEWEELNNPPEDDNMRDEPTGGTNGTGTQE